jgi:hypothetical protein
MLSDVVFKNLMVEHYVSLRLLARQEPLVVLHKGQRICPSSPPRKRRAYFVCGPQYSPLHKRYIIENASLCTLKYHQLYRRHYTEHHPWFDCGIDVRQHLDIERESLEGSHSRSFSRYSRVSHRSIALNAHSNCIFGGTLPPLRGVNV